MRYQKFSSVAALSPFIECYFVWEGDVLEKTEVQSPPNCFGAIVFNYRDPTWAYQHDDQEKIDQINIQWDHDRFVKLLTGAL